MSIVTKYTRRIGGHVVGWKCIAALRWNCSDPVILGQISVRNVDRLRFHDNMVSLSCKSTVNLETFE